ncbi:hypothetical protein HZS_702 [Henneguya salminicola]|nr:hypothetical protein HZS_702 [Henneguya salminicola]
MIEFSNDDVSRKLELTQAQDEITLALPKFLDLCGRILLKEDVEVIYLRDLSKNVRKVILLNKILIVANEIDNKLIVDNIYSIESHLFTIETTKCGIIENIRIDALCENEGINIKVNNISQNTLSTNISIFLLFFVYNIRNSNLLNEENKKGHELGLFTFKSIIVCTVCGKYLKGLICQGYACYRKECNTKLHYSCFEKLKQCTAL